MHCIERWDDGGGNGGWVGGTNKLTCYPVKKVVVGFSGKTFVWGGLHLRGVGLYFARYREF